MAEVVGVVASVAGLVQITLAVCRHVHTYIVGVHRADKDRQELLDELEALSRIIIYLQDAVRENWGSSPALRELCTREGVLQGCALDLRALEARFKPNNRHLGRLKWPLKTGETKEYLEKIERFKSTVNMALGLDNHAILRIVEAQTKSTNLLVQDYRVETQSMINLAIQNVGSQEDTSVSKRRGDILNWIYPGDFNAKHYEIQHRRQKGTGEWLLRAPKFVEWVEGKLKSRLLWGYGIPGAGKTFLSSTVIDHLGKASSTKRGLGYVYFDYKDQRRQTPIEVISSLIRQLASQTQDIPAALEEVYKKSVSDGKRPIMDELYNILTTISRLFDQVFFVFDALDECDPEKQRRELLPLFQRMGKSGINIFLTSRPHPGDINDSLQDAEKIKLAAQKEDITTYIQERISETPRARDLIHQGNYSGEIISKIEACANGMFLLVHLHISYLCQQTTIRQILDALEKLETLSAGEISLYPTYDSAIDRITSQHPPEAELAIKILTWLVKAKRVLKLDEIREAVSIVPGRYEMDVMDLPDKRTLLEVCGGLVVADDQTGSIRLAHYTVQEYLLERRFSLLKSNAEISIACLTYLSFNPPPRSCNSQTERMEICKRHPFFRYSSEMMIFHVRSCEQGSVIEPLLHFLGKPNNIDYFNEIRSETSEYYYKHGGRSPLHIASDAGHLGAVKRLIEMGEDPSASDRQFRIPLHVAASEGQKAVVDYLLQVGYRRKPWIATVKGHHGYTALHEAASRGHERVVILLLRRSLYPPWIRNAHKIVDDDKRTALYLAALHGHEAVVKLLLDKGADVNAINGSKMTALHEAAASGHEAVVKLLLDKGADVHAIDSSKRTALHEAAARGREAVVKLLLDKGADVNAISDSKWTALHTAASSGNEAVVKLLLDKGADVNAISDSKLTALHTAASSGNEAVVKLILDKGADVNAIDNSKWTALHTAAGGGYEAVVKLLLDKGTDVNAIDDLKWTALHRAANGGYEAVVKLLLDKGADVNAIDNSKRTALHKAAARGHEAVVKLLLDKGADVNAIGGSKWTALHKAADGGYEAVVKLLLDKGADVNAISDSWTALYRAAAGGYEAVVKLLLDKGADVNAINNLKWTALHAAAARGYEAVVKLLLDKGADVNAIDDSKRTALHTAAARGDGAVVKLLLDKGADVNAIDDSKRTALHEAAARGHEPVVKLLLDKGADVNAIDDSKWTALHEAAGGGYEAVVKLLLDKGADVNAIDDRGQSVLDTALSIPSHWGGKDKLAVIKLLLKNGAEKSSAISLLPPISRLLRRANPFVR